MKNARTILILLLLLGMTLAANFFIRSQVATTRSVRHRALLDSRMRVSEISFVGTNSVPVVLKADGAWRLTKPFAAPAEEQLVLKFIDLFAWSPVEDALTDAELLKLGRTRDDFGLGPSACGISFSDGVRTNQIVIGGLTPTSNSVYVAMSEFEGVLVMPRAILEAAAIDDRTFRSRKVFPYDPDFVIGFDIKKSGASSIALTRDVDCWRIGRETAAEKKTRDFLAAVADAQAVDFVWPTISSRETESLTSAKLSAYGLDVESAWIVVLHCQDGLDRRILLGRDAPDGRVYALVHDGAEVVTLEASLKTALLEGPRAFTDARLFPIEESAVASFSIQTDEATYIIARAPEGAWRLDSPLSAPASSETVSTLLANILSLTSADLTDGKGLRISVATNLSSAVVLPRSILGGETKLSDLRSKEILRINPAIVRRLVQTARISATKRSTQSIVYSRENRVWNVEASDEVEAVVIERRVEKVLSILQSLMAVRVVALRPSAADWAKYGFENPYSTLAVDQEKEGAVRLNLLIGDETEGGRFATVGSSEAVFVISSDTVDALTKALIDD